MTFWAHLFLGIIAAATLVMAVIQVGVVVYARLLARQVARLIGQVEQELKPLSVSVNAIGRDAARAAALAADQVERVDRLFAQLTERAEQTAQAVQKAVAAPAREGAALIAGLKAAVSALRERRDRPGTHSARTEDEEALFIG